MLDFPTLSVKAVLFDLDDTLFDHSYSTRQGLQTIGLSYEGLQQYSTDELFATYMRLLDEVHLRVLEGSMTIDEARLQRFQRFFLLYGGEGLDIPAVAEHASGLHRTAYQASRQVVAGVVPLLEYLHGRCKIAVVTNNIIAEQIDKLHYLHLDHLVDELVTSEETGSIKPDTGIFRAALERVGCLSSETVMIGDAWQADILGATRAGIRALWFNRAEKPCPDPNLALEFHSFEPLAEMLELIQGNICTTNWSVNSPE
jgi:HAD superfamily hydrolase (TIGR01549 family)